MDGTPSLDRRGTYYSGAVKSGVAFAFRTKGMYVVLAGAVASAYGAGTLPEPWRGLSGILTLLFVGVLVFVGVAEFGYDHKAAKEVLRRFSERAGSWRCSSPSPTWG